MRLIKAIDWKTLTGRNLATMNDYNNIAAGILVRVVEEGVAEGKGIWGEVVEIAGERLLINIFMTDGRETCGERMLVGRDEVVGVLTREELEALVSLENTYNSLS